MTADEAALDRRFDVAVALAREAGSLAAGMRGALGPIDAKSPIDFCTAADRAVERLIRDRVAATFGDLVIGEELGADPAAGDGGGDGDGFTWVVDPIDGTTGYIHGDGRWCVSIAVLRAGRVAAGVLNAPATGRLFTARAGRGARLNDRPIAVSRLAHDTAPLVELGWSDRRPLATWCDLVQALVRNGIEFRRHGSGALGLADVASGAADGYVELHINAWDVLAGLLLVREAGGWTSDFLANDGLLHGNAVIAATPEIADTLRRLVDATGSPA